jgi:LmbE family N-acetylglucosaminyl deacetylase
MSRSGSSLPSAVAVALWTSGSPVQALAQQPDAAALRRQLERLSVVGSVLYVAAHPDDENTRFLAWLVNAPKVRAGYLSLTRGEGGQNLLGPEQAPLLGVIRTQELLAARALDHAEQLFGRERDFGYSKTPEETLAIWGKDAALSDVVWAIRRFKPDLVVTRFSPEVRDTHGHHTASAMLALEAFRAAADPKAFPEQLAHEAPWQARRIVWNRGVFGPLAKAELEGFFALDVGAYDPLLGVSLGELAARARSMHKSQGFGAAPQRGPVLEYFRLLGGEPFGSSLFDGVDLTWGRVRGSERLRELLGRALAQFSDTNPAASIPLLLEARDALDLLPDNAWKAPKRRDLDAVISACAGLFAQATSKAPTAVPGGELPIALFAINRSPLPVRLRQVRLGGEEVRVEAALEPNTPWSLERTLALPRELPPSSPYWLTDEPTPGRWTVRDPRWVDLPEAPPPIGVDFVFTLREHTLELTRAVDHAWTDPVAGERRRPLEVLPPVTVNPLEALLMFPDGEPKKLRVAVRASRIASGAVTPVPPAGFSVEPVSLPFSLTAVGAEQELAFRVAPLVRLSGEDASAGGVLSLMVELGEPAGGAKALAKSVLRVDYPHLPPQTVTAPATVRLVRFQLRRALTRVGYIPGAGDEVAAALRQVGYEVAVLSDDALAQQPLEPDRSAEGRSSSGPLVRGLEAFEAIVVGVRAFNTNPRMAAHRARLLDYVQRGGTLVVQYNVQNRLSKIEGELGPWPFSISQDRVTDEAAPVELLVQGHPLLRAPNRITDRDFADWVQERGLYFADKWDERYTPLLSMHDPGEPPRLGSLLVARYGKGTFIYTGLSFFRQLPAGVPGAYRLFANLLSPPR